MLQIVHFRITYDDRQNTEWYIKTYTFLLFLRMVVGTKRLFQNKKTYATLARLRYGHFYAHYWLGIFCDTFQNA